MKKLIAAFSSQLEEAMKIGNSFSFNTPTKQFSNIVVSGLGGSGIGGSIVQNYVYDKINLPFVVNKDYTLPHFVGDQSLVIICSYSGNTEETVAAMEMAIQQKATIVCVTSGGKIAAMAQEHGFDCIIVPGGMPPRSCFGYSMVQLLFILQHFQLITDDFKNEIANSIALINDSEKSIKAKAKNIAKKLKGKMPIIYSSAAFEGVAIRFRQQLNENSKILCWHGAIPEMNHNELVGWRDDAENMVVVLLRNTDDYDRVQTRMEINKKIFKKHNASIIELYSEGNSYLEKAIYLIHVTDWVSYDLAELRDLDPVEVKVIDFLKSSLANS